jgi:hypothetical protein
MNSRKILMLRQQLRIKIYLLLQEISTRKSWKGLRRIKETLTFKFPTWLYGPPKGKLIKVEVEVEDCPLFGNKAYVEFDSARTAFLSIDMQVDFCSPKGYVDVMGLWSWTNFRSHKTNYARFGYYKKGNGC